jgi:hypothetical protein
MKMLKGLFKDLNRSNEDLIKSEDLLDTCLDFLAATNDMTEEDLTAYLVTAKEACRLYRQWQQPEFRDRN